MKKRVASAGTGSISIPEFDDETSLPGCCGVRVLHGFSGEAQTVYEPGAYYHKPLSGLTKKQALAYWDSVCEREDVACLLASTTSWQKFAEENLAAGGWKQVGTSFESATSGSIITLWQYIRSDWVMK